MPAYVTAYAYTDFLQYSGPLQVGLRNIFGGEVRSLETLLDRARREAVLRLKESCPDADIIVNLRLDTSSISGAKPDPNNKSVVSVEVIASGTAIRYARNH